MEGAAVRRDLYNGFGTTFSRAFELMISVGLLVVLGRFLDERIGTSPVFTVVLGAAAVTGGFLRTWYAYVERMKSEEAASPWRKS